MPTPIISLDLETTGLDPDRHGPWEIAWATALHDTDAHTVTVINRAQWFISLNGTEQLDPVALRIGGFQKRYADISAAGRRLPWWAIQGMLFSDLDIVRSEAALAMPYVNGHSDERHPAPKTHLIGAVPQFDHRMLERWLGWNHQHWHYHLVDVETLSAGWLGIAPPFDTKDMTVRMLGHGWQNPWGNIHEALADVRWNLELYAKATNATLVIPPDMEPIT
jgi:oligoribonuclease (3'-5' exoribonuclease)